MLRAYIAIITGTGAAKQAAARIRDLPGVDEAHAVAGEFDVIAEVDGESVRDLQRAVTGGIHEIEGVGTTRTYIQLE